MGDNPFIAAQAERNTVSKCQLCPQISALDKERRRQAWDAILGVSKVDGHPIHAAVIVNVLNELGVRTSETSVANHRRGECSLLRKRTNE